MQTIARLAANKVVVACRKAIVDEARLAANKVVSTSVSSIYCPNRTDFYLHWFRLFAKNDKGARALNIWARVGAYGLDSYEND